MSAASAGLLTSMPVLAFAVFGALAPVAARRIGIHRVTLLSLLAVTGGLLGRVLVDSEPAFLALSMLAAGRHGDGERAAPLAGQAALPGPHRSGHRAVHDRAGRRPDRVADADGADRGRGSTAGGPGWASGRRWRSSRCSRGWALVAHDVRVETAPRSIGFLDVARTPPRSGDGRVLRTAVAPGVRRLRLVRDPLARRGLQRRGGGRAGRAWSPRCRSRSRCGRRQRWPSPATAGGSWPG